MGFPKIEAPPNHPFEYDFHGVSSIYHPYCEYSHVWKSPDDLFFQKRPGECHGLCQWTSADGARGEVPAVRLGARRLGESGWRGVLLCCMEIYHVNPQKKGLSLPFKKLGTDFPGWFFRFGWLRKEAKEWALWEPERRSVQLCEDRHKWLNCQRLKVLRIMINVGYWLV